MVKAAIRQDTAVAAGAASVAALAWRHRGVLRVTVIVKASFAFAHDATMPRVDPQPIFRAEVNHGNNPTRTTRFAADLALYVERAEILFTGHAYPPDGHPLETMPVRLGVFSGMEPILDKMLLIRQKGGFRKLPLVYERAYGGIGWPDNPLGVGALAGTGEPSVFDPFDDKHLAGFGPIGGAWIARRKLLGSVPRKALEQSFVELPDGFDFGYFQSAPADQRVAFLRGDEWIVMDGLHPTVPRMRMRLPGARALALVYGLSPWGVTEGQPLSLHADTLRIDGDDQRCTLSFRGVFPVAADEALACLRVIAGVELPGEPITWPSPDELPARAPTSEVGATAAKISDSGSISITDEDFESVRGQVLDGTLTLEAETSDHVAELPFQPGPAPETVSRASGALPGSDSRRPLLRATLPVESVPDFDLVLPFRTTPEAPPLRGESTLASELEPAPAPSVPVTMGETPKPPAPPAPPKEPGSASPWAAAPPPPPREPTPPRPPPAQGPPAATPKLKKGLYGKFGGS